MADHLAALEETAAAVAALRPLPNVPLVVISSGAQPADVIVKHRALAHRSSGGRHIVATGSGHWIQFDEPELVVNVIRELVEATR
jgi:pimeloyl-ACP methyl ester carboxylesterase